MAKKRKASGEQSRHKNKKMVRLSDEIHQQMTMLAERKRRQISSEVGLALEFWIHHKGNPPGLDEFLAINGGTTDE